MYTPQAASIGLQELAGPELAARTLAPPWATASPCPRPALETGVGVAGVWQELLSQVLGSDSGNLRLEQSFPFGENGLSPPLSPCGVGRACWLGQGTAWSHTSVT